jgi:hypothetical protein
MALELYVLVPLRKKRRYWHDGYLTAHEDQPGHLDAHADHSIHSGNGYQDNSYGRQLVPASWEAGLKLLWEDLDLLLNAAATIPEKPS